MKNEKTLRERWEAIVNHSGWDGSKDVDFLINEGYSIEDAEDAQEEYEYQKETTGEYRGH